MLNKLSVLPVYLFMKANGFIADVKKTAMNFGKDERGLSGVVVAVILVLLAVVLLVIFWEQISKLVGDIWIAIFGESDKLPGGN